MMPKSDIFAVF